MTKAGGLSPANMGTGNGPGIAPRVSPSDCLMQVRYHQYNDTNGVIVPHAVSQVPIASGSMLTVYESFRG